LTSKKTSFLLSVTLIVALLLFACRADNAPNSRGYVAEQLNIMYSNSYGMAALQYMMSTKALIEALPSDVTVNWKYISGAPETREALVSGEIDLAVTGAPSAILATENSLPIRILSDCIFQPLKIYSNRPNILSLDDIGPNDKISIASRGSSTELAMLYLGKERYGNSNKFINNLVVMQYADVFASLESSDDLACSLAVFPNIRRFDQIENTFLLDDLTSIMYQCNLSNFLIVSERFAQENPALIDIIYKVARETIDKINENPLQAAEILHEYYGEEITVSDIEEQLRSAPLRMEISEEGYNGLANLMHETGMIPNPPKKFSELPNYDSIPKIA
jgi:ABC-type nitrate/sulfonate/bicarbonate transport system substrate-binding protein